MTRDSTANGKNTTGETGGTTLFEQLASLLDDAAGAADALRQDGETFLRIKLENIAAGMDFVPRDEFEAVRALALKALAESQAAQKELTSLRRKLTHAGLRRNNYKPLRKSVRNSRQKSQ